MPGTQTEGSTGRAANVSGGTKDDQPDGITSHDFGRGANTDHAMKVLESNRAMYQRDQTLETAHGAEKEPDAYEEKISKPSFV